MIGKTIQDIYDEIAPDYDGRYLGVECFVEEDLIQEHFDQMKLGSVLDLGCGTGHAITVCEIESKNYFGIDFSEGMLEQAFIRYPNYSFLEHDLKEKIYGQWDIVLALFGQINYIGLERYLQILRYNMKSNGQFLAVMYAENYKPDYLNGETNFYSLGFVREAFSRWQRPFTIWGMSYPLPGDGDWSQDSYFEAQKMLTANGDLETCKYWILTG